MIRQLIYPRARLGGRHWDTFALSLDLEGADVRRVPLVVVVSVASRASVLRSFRRRDCAVKGNTLGSSPTWACVITTNKFLKPNSHSVSVPFDFPHSSQFNLGHS